MDIPAMSTAMSASTTSAGVGIKVMKMAMDTMEEQGQQLLEMMDDMARFIDVKV